MSESTIRWLISRSYTKAPASYALLGLVVILSVLPPVLEAVQDTTSSTITILNGDGEPVAVLQAQPPNRIQIGEAHEDAGMIATVDTTGKGFLVIRSVTGDDILVVGLDEKHDGRLSAHRSASEKERSELIESIIRNFAKGIAIVIALLVLRRILPGIGRVLTGGRDRASLERRVEELEQELERLRSAS